jgi:hypothetical protein
MTAGPAHVDPPPHPLPALTTSELSWYRTELEDALAAVPGPSPAGGQLRQQPAEVHAEQQSRTRISGGGRA